MNNNKIDKIYSLNAFRFILALMIILGHSWIILYKHIDKLGYHVEALAVDGFFILSGLLLARSCFSIMENKLYDPSTEFLKLNKKRFKRLWFEYFFALLVMFVVRLCRDAYLIPINLLFIGQVNKIPSIIGGTWYVFMFFYIGALLSALVLYKNKFAIYVLLPLIAFVSLLLISSSVGHLVMHGDTYHFSKYLATGFFKAFFELSVGMMLFYFIQYIQQNNFYIKKCLVFPLYLLLEICGIYFVIYAVSQSYLSMRDFLVVFGYSFIFIVLYLRKEYLLKFLSYKGFEKISNCSYMLYLTHGIIIRFIKNNIDYLKYSRWFVYATIIILATIFAIICYHIQKYIFTKLKYILFIDKTNMSQSLENVGGGKKSDIL